MDDINKIVDSGNFLFAQQFAPFRNQLELGKGVYLNVGSGRPITPYIIEFELDFENREQFSIVFSNRFKRHDNVNTLKDMIESSYSSSRSFDTSKYIYNQTSSQASTISKFMSDSLDAAKNTILAAANQSVVINGAGIHVGGDSNYQIRIVDKMIAMSDDNWQTSKLAIGHFAAPEIGSYFGVNAEVIGGKLIVGHNLIIENKTDNGIMQFKVDSTGAWLYNSTFVLQSDKGGKMLLCPQYGIAAGSSSLYTTNGTTVFPSFIDKDEKIIFDRDGFPSGANFYIDPRDGKAYFRGSVYATDGVFNGTVYAKAGEFDGIIKARDIRLPNGDTMTSIINDKRKIDADWLDLYGINVKNKAGNTVMTIDENGLRFGTGYSPIQYQFSTSFSGPWHDSMGTNDKYRRDSLDGGITWGSPYQFRGTDGQNGSDANVPQWVKSVKATYIDNQWVISPHIYGGDITSETTINVGTDATIGRWLKLKASANDMVGNGPDNSNMTKIEDVLLEKQDKLAAGDGMSIQDGTISVATPVKGVFSQEEFDALPEEQRNQGMYIIPDGGDSGGGGLTQEEADRRYVQLDDTVPIRGDVYLTDGNLPFEGLEQAPLYKLEALYIRANMRTRAPKARESSTLLRRWQDFHRTTRLRRAPQSDNGSRCNGSSYTIRGN